MHYSPWHQMEMSCELHIPPILLLRKDLCSMHRTGNWLGLGNSLAVVKRRTSALQNAKY
jgi:hypothetical protein